MKAVGYLKSLAIAEPESLIDFAADLPQPAGRDLLVAVKAVSVNPVDYQGAQARRAASRANRPRSSAMTRPAWSRRSGRRSRCSSRATRSSTPARLRGPAPTASFIWSTSASSGASRQVGRFRGQAAALPLTSITAWEMLFDRFAVPRGRRRTGTSLLIIGGAGGVGSICIQLARAS